MELCSSYRTTPNVPVREAHGTFHTLVLGNQGGLYIGIKQCVYPVAILPIDLQAEIGFQHLPHHLDNRGIDDSACTVPG